MSRRYYWNETRVPARIYAVRESRILAHQQRISTDLAKMTHGAQRSGTIYRSIVRIPDGHVYTDVQDAANDLHRSRNYIYRAIATRHPVYLTDSQPPYYLEWK